MTKQAENKVTDIIMTVLYSMIGFVAIYMIVDAILKMALVDVQTEGFSLIISTFLYLNVQMVSKLSYIADMVNNPHL